MKNVIFIQIIRISYLGNMILLESNEEYMMIDSKGSIEGTTYGKK